MKFYYRRLKELREEHTPPLTQHAIAQLLATTQQTYSLWERGDRELPLHHAITLARFYQVSLDYLTGLTNARTALVAEKKRD